MEEKFITHGVETFNLAPLKYKWAFLMAQKSLRNHWHPSEVPMGNDKACFEHSLNEREKHMFTHVFSTLTTADLAIASNLTEQIYGLVKAAEIRLYLSRQIAEEGLHSLSYQHCIEVLGLPEDEVYTLYRRVPAIGQWFDWGKSNRLENSEDIILPLIFQYAIFEGVFFMTAFASLFSLQRRNLMTGTGSQIAMIMKDESLHVAFGIKLINEIIKEMGTKPAEEEVYRLFENSMERIDKWTDHCIPDVLGYSSALHKEHCRYLANTRLKALGYGPLYQAKEALPWLSEQISTLKEANFFEKTITMYQSAGALDGTW